MRVRACVCVFCFSGRRVILLEITIVVVLLSITVFPAGKAGHHSFIIR